MAKANRYAVNNAPTLNDLLFGSRFDGQDQNITIESIIFLLNAINGKDYIQFKFSPSDYGSVGSFTSNASITNPSLVTKLFFNIKSATKEDLTDLFVKIDTLQNIVIELRNPSNSNNFATFKITNITNNTEYFELDVVIYKSFFSGVFTSGTTYSAYFDVKENFEDKLNQGAFVGTAETLNADIQTREPKVTGKSLVDDDEIAKLAVLDATADIDKPVSTLQQEAIDLAVDAQITNSTALAEPTIPIVALGNVHILGVGPGTYPNWGGMVIPANHTGTLRRVDGVFTVSIVEVTGLDLKLNVSDVIDILTSTETNKPGSANNDKLLNEKNINVEKFIYKASPFDIADIKTIGNEWLKEAIVEVSLSGTYDPSLTYHMPVIFKNNNGSGVLTFDFYARDTDWVSAGKPSSIDIATDINTDKLILVKSNGTEWSVEMLINPSKIPDGTVIGGDSRFPFNIECWKKENNVISYVKKELEKPTVNVTSLPNGKITNAYMDSVTFLDVNDEIVHSGDSIFSSSLNADWKGQGQHHTFLEDGFVYKIGTAFVNIQGGFKGVVRVTKIDGEFIGGTTSPYTGELVQEYTFDTGEFKDDHEIILTTPTLFKKGQSICVFAMPENGGVYNVGQRFWSTPYLNQANPYNRNVLFLYSNGTQYGAWNKSSSTNDYAYWQVPLRLWTNAVTVKELIAIEEKILDVKYNPRIVLPSKLDAVVGKEFNLYYDAVCLLPNSGTQTPNIMFGIECNIGTSQNRSFRVTPTDGDIGNHTLIFTVYDNFQNILATKTTTLVVVNDANPSSIKKILCIGDSTTDDTGEVVTTLHTNLNGFGGNIPLFIGTHGIGLAKHEGRTGKTYNYYTNGQSVYKFTVTGLTGAPALSPTWTYTSNGTGYILVNMEINVDGSGNGYVIADIWTQPNSVIGNGWSGTLTRLGNEGPSTITVTNTEILSNYSTFKDNNGIGSLNFGYYISKFGFGTCDLLSVDLGINDSRDNFKTEIERAQIITDAKTLINAFFTYNPTGKVVICLPKSSANTKSIGSYKQDSYRTNIHKLRELIIENFDNGIYNSNCFVSGACFGVDRYYGYPLTTQVVSARNATIIEKHLDDVHPILSGYQQMADGMTATILRILS